MPETPPPLRFELSLADYHALSRQLNVPTTLQRVLSMLFVSLVSLIVVIVGTSIAGTGFLWGTFMGILFVLAGALRKRVRLQPRRNGALLCPYLVQLSDDGVHLETPNWTTDSSWKGVLAVEDTPQHCFLRTDSIAAYVIPKGAFGSAESARQFVAFARERSAAAQAPSRSNS